MKVFLLSVLALIAGANAQTPVEKVTQMLGDLQSKVQEQGKGEASEYDKYACFCKDQTESKRHAIATSESRKAELTASIAATSADRDATDAVIAAMQKDAAKLQADLSALRAKRTDQRAQFDKNHKTARSGIDSLERAITMLNKAKAAGKSQEALVELRAVLAEVPAALDASAKAAENYGFHSEEIIGTLQTVLKTFRAKKFELEDAEGKHFTEFQLAENSLKKALEDSSSGIAAKQAESAAATERVAAAQRDLAVVNASLLDDKDYLQDLTSKCKARAAEWDARSALRAKELTAIAQAVAIVKGSVTAHNQGTTWRASSKSRADQAAPHESLLALEDREKEAKEERRLLSLIEGPAVAPMLLQVAAHLAPANDAIVSLLRERGASLQSPELSALAVQLSTMGDFKPFEKVKEMIETLIKRLQTEAASEQTHKAWCDTEIARETQTKQQKEEVAARLKSEIEALAAKIARLSSDISSLNQDIEGMEAALQKETDLRAADKAENQKAQQVAQQGAEAARAALNILGDFYKSAQGASFVEVQETARRLARAARRVTEDPANPFKGGAYKGAQDDAFGVLGMLDVIASDFDRAAKDAREDEKAAQAEFEALQSKTKVSIVTQQTAMHAFEKDKAAAVTTKQDRDSAAEANNQLLEAAVNALQKLQAPCVNKDTTYEDRRDKRKEEIEALKDAFKLLGGEMSLQQTNANGKLRRVAKH